MTFLQSIRNSKKMLELGYKDSIPTNDCETIYLPNTTLHHATKMTIIARDDAREVAKQLGITLDRCVATNWAGWAAIRGEPFK